MRFGGRTAGAGCLTKSHGQHSNSDTRLPVHGVCQHGGSQRSDTGTDSRASQRLTRRSRHDAPRPLTDDGSRDTAYQWKNTGGGRARAGPHPAQRGRGRGVPRGRRASPRAQRRRPAHRPAAGSALPSAGRDRPPRPAAGAGGTRRGASRPAGAAPPLPERSLPAEASPGSSLPPPPAAAGGASRKAGPVPAPRRPHSAARPRGARSQPSARPSAPRLPQPGGSGAAHRRRALSPAGREERERSSRPRRQWLPCSYERPATPRAPNGCCATADVRLQVPACRAAGPGRAPASCSAALRAGAAGCRPGWRPCCCARARGRPARGERRLRGRGLSRRVEGWPDCGVPAARFVTGHGARSEVSAAVSFSAAQRVKFSPSGRRTGCPSAPLIALGLDCSFGACWRCPGRRAGSPCQCLPALTAINPVLLRA